MLRKSISAAVICLLAAGLLSSVAGCTENENKNPVITLIKRNGEPDEKIQISVSQTTFKLSNHSIEYPKREGWFFDGWYLDEDCTQSADGATIDKDVTFYAGWTDSILVNQYTKYETPWKISGYDDLFSLSVKVEPYENDEFGYPQMKFTVNVTPKGDFTGDEASDRFEMQIGYIWMSDEKVLGEYVSDEVVGLAQLRGIWLEKNKGFALHDEVYIQSYDNNNMTYPIYNYTFANEHTKSRIDYVFDAMLQYKH